jgi:hypothetical protein
VSQLRFTLFTGRGCSDAPPINIADKVRSSSGQVAQKGFAKANVAAARKLGIRLWIMLRDQIDYAEFCRRGLARQS